ncbi:FecR family protein [Bacteroides ovatus]|uniref:FecR family protein n=1 Tax=Bacteroides ovatus TaxID=28116 RepID=UPI0039B3B312
MESMTSDLIIGFLKGSLNEKEINQFYDWVNETPENKQIFFEAKMVYDACLSKGSNIDMDKSWQRLLEKKQKQAPRKIYTLFRKVQAYAAVAVIAVAFTSVLFWLLGDASSVPVARYVGGDGIVADKVVLPDGTEISMGSQTNFRYDPQYGKEKRVVYLEGEAFFNVAKQKDKPFIVVVNGQEIEALGTKFNVDAYPSDSVVTTTLLEGSIRLVSERVSASTVLTPNQQYIYHKNKGSYKVAQVDAALYTSWISGYYYFHEENLEGILARLGNIYGVSFRIQSDKLKERRFTGTFYRGQNIKDILDIINISIPIRYSINNRQVTIN